MNFLHKRQSMTFALLLLVLTTAVSGAGSHSIETNRTHAASQASVTELQQLRDTLSEHPAVGSVSVDTVDAPNGTAVLLLQRHIAPGTKPEDPANDDAVVTQKELVGIIGDLHAQGHAATALVEGKPYDPASGALTGDLDALRTQTKNTESLRQIIAELKVRDDLPVDLREKLTKQESAFIAERERKLILRGAAQTVYAQGTDLTLQGAEKPETYQKSAKIVVEYMQLTKRIKALSGKSGTPAQILRSAHEPAKLIDMSALQKLLKQRRGASSNASGALAKTLDAMKTHSQSDDDAAIERAQELIREIANGDTPTAAKHRTASAAKPSNPYAHTTDVTALKKRLGEVEADLQSTVVDQRNADTAENFTNLLRDTGASVGLIQFGAKHRDGLVKELLARGMNVVTVTPKSLQE